MNNKALTVLGIAIIELLVAIFATLRKPSVSLPGELMKNKEMQNARLSAS